MFKIGLDLGYGHCKLVNQNNLRRCFPSLARDGSKADIDCGLGANLDYIATINQKVWYIGNMAAKESRFALRAFDDAERFTNSAFQAMLATCLAVACNGSEKILLVTGLPFSAYKNTGNIFQEFLTRFTAAVEIQGDIKQIQVERAYVFPQAAGIFFSPDCETIKQSADISPGNLATVIDIGYRTTDIAVFQALEDGQYSLIQESSFTADVGMVSVFRDLGTQIASDIKAFEVSMEKAEQVFFKGELRSRGKRAIDYRNINENTAEKVVGSIVDIFKLNGPGTEMENTIIFAGGGSIALRPQLEKYFPGAYYLPNAQFANALGFLNVARSLDATFLAQV